MPGGKRQGGVTLSELLVAFSIVGILAMVAVPGFTEIVRQNSVTSAINQFVAAHHLARAEAVSRRKPVVVCKSADAESSTPSCGTSLVNWENGWIVFVNDDNDAPPARDSTETILQVSSGLSHDITLRGSTGVASSLSYDAAGEISAAGTLVLCAGNDLAYARALFLQVNGRIRAAERNSAGVPVDDGGTALTSCTSP